MNINRVNVTMKNIIFLKVVNILTIACVIMKIDTIMTTIQNNVKYAVHQIYMFLST